MSRAPFLPLHGTLTTNITRRYEKNKQQNVIGIVFPSGCKSELQPIQRMPGCLHGTENLAEISFLDSYCDAT